MSTYKEILVHQKSVPPESVVYKLQTSHVGESGNAFVVKQQARKCKSTWGVSTLCVDSDFNTHTYWIFTDEEDAMFMSLKYPFQRVYMWPAAVRFTIFVIDQSK